MTKRRPAYIDPRELAQPGRCLLADGVYRLRAGWEQESRLLTAPEIAALPASALDPHMTDDEWQARVVR